MRRGRQQRGASGPGEARVLAILRRTPHQAAGCALQMEEEGVPSTTLREISLLQMLSESNHIVK